MKRNYCLVFIKEAYYMRLGNGRKLVKHLGVHLPMVLYRKNGKFYVHYALIDKCKMTWLQAWFWYLLIYIYGRMGSQKLFKYKYTEGRVEVRKIY